MPLIMTVMPLSEDKQKLFKRLLPTKQIGVAKCTSTVEGRIEPMYCNKPLQLVDADLNKRGFVVTDVQLGYIVYQNKDVKYKLAIK